jgi:hypothetical protein
MAARRWAARDEGAQSDVRFLLSASVRRAALASSMPCAAGRITSRRA